MISCVVKKCYKCNQILSGDCFARNRSKRDGLATECKRCIAEYHKSDEYKKRINERDRERYRSDPEYRQKLLLDHAKNYVRRKDRILAQNKEYRAKNAERIAERNRRWAEQHPELMRRYKQSWRERNAAQLREAAAAYREKNREIVNARNSEWRKKNPGQARAAVVARRARIAGAMIGDAKAIAEFYRRIKSVAEVSCFYCGILVGRHDRHVDHKTPLARGGAHSLENLCCACRACNQRKGTMTEQEFRDAANKSILG